HDEFSWPKTADGIYTVRSGYQAIQDWREERNCLPTSSNINSNPIWQKLWSLKIPPKYNTLMWRILHKALPVQSNLMKRGLNCYPLCPRCNETIEDQNHVFSGCVWAKQVWFASSLTLKFRQDNFDFKNWIENSFINTSDQNMELICSLCYHIWKARNLLIFQNKNLPVMDVVFQAQDSIIEYQLHFSQNSEHDFRATQMRLNNVENWIPPPRNTLKLNVDAHLIGDGHWGLGLILRKEDGSCVGAATRVARGMVSAVEAEAQGLVEAIDLLAQIPHQAAIIELDNQIVVQSVLRRRYPRTCWGSLARKSGEFLENNPQISICWIKRTGNTVAHHMARWAAIE
ncbi:ribonuclease H protein, partial [Trifolium medium]|nr:ribonuclease H protein [Trifolium medium]